MSGRVLGSLLLLSCAAPRGAAARNAFYILFANQVPDNSAWPTVCQNNGAGPQGNECVNITDYAAGVVILSPQNATPAVVAAIKAAAPGASVLGYFDFGGMPYLNASAGAPLNISCACCTGHVMGDLPGRNCSTTYACGAGTFTTALAAAMPPTTFVARLDLAPGRRELQCGYPGLAAYVPSSATAALIADFVADFFTRAGLDGAYLDGFLSSAVRAKGVAEACGAAPGAACDYNGDGKPESPAEALAQYTAWAPALVARLRARLGADAVILANSAGALSDASLSGLTIEMESCLDAGACTDAMLGQAAVTATLGRAPSSVFWLTHSETMPPAQQCAEVAAWQAAHPFILSGTDFFDGSHVVC